MLTLSIRGGAAAHAPTELVLDRQGAFVGRAAECDWALPDPTRHLSSRHFEIRFDGSNYVLVDHSSNGTFLARTGERVGGQHVLRNGDLIGAGPFTIAATLGANGAAAPWRGWHDEEPGEEPDASSGWASERSGTGSMPTPATGWTPAPIAGSAGWGPSTARDDSGWKPQTGPSLARQDPHRAAGGWGTAETPRASQGGWAAPAVQPSAVRSAWDSAAPPPDPASAWSSAAPDRPPPPSPDDLWGRIAEGNVVDWARGGFGQPVESARDPLGLTPPPAPPPAAPAPPPHQPHAGDAFLAALGVDPARFAPEAASRAALLFRRLVAGMVVMLEARARAKAQLGAEPTAYSPDGHNPLKYARAPEEALAMLLGAPQPGFMPPERAVEDAFEDLQSHQMATLRAMQGALRTTLERFSPSTIRARAKAEGVLERILPAARDAALWQAYEREFGGVAKGSDEAFLDMFAKEFREAYNQQARLRR